MKLAYATHLLAFVVVATGCSPADPEEAADASDGGAGCVFCPTDATSDAPLELQAKGIIDHVCANAECHGLGGMAFANLAFSAGNEFTDIVNVESFENPPMLRVKPGDPENSYVYLKLRCDGGYWKACMPLNAPNPRYAQVFHDWIEAGAPTD